VTPGVVVLPAEPVMEGGVTDTGGMATAVGTGIGVGLAMGVGVAVGVGVGLGLPVGVGVGLGVGVGIGVGRAKVVKVKSPVWEDWPVVFAAVTLKWYKLAGDKPDSRKEWEVDRLSWAELKP